VLEYTGYADYAGVDFYAPATVTKDPDLVRLYTKEEAPHIIFSDKIKDLSRSIVGDEKNPATILKLIYDWMNANIPWAGAREYSTIPNISEYCVDKKYGDCGIQSLLLITLCRYNGIPAKWQSGWMVLPDEVNLHDWCEVYLDQYGWFPVDPSFKLLPADNEKVRYFYVNGIDPYHFVVNNDISKPLYPAKIYPRSETVDFQRGELEWRGGNLYFDTWDYDMKVSYTPVEQ
jgi:transglutaminase-like putative cysteine protease